MADLGKVTMTDGGNYSADITYEKLTFVHYLGDAYMTLKTVKGVTPTNDGVNYRLFCKSAELATLAKAGIVLPDGTTITIDEDGKISAKTATKTELGVVMGSADINVANTGALSVNTAFEQATELANIIAGEAIATVLGKVSAAIAKTMNLDENALLKNMLTGIDVNDANKVPNAAFIHTLVERIGMGTTLGIGSNLTDGVNQLNSNLTTLGLTECVIFSVGFGEVPAGSDISVNIPAQYQGYTGYFCNCIKWAGVMLANVEDNTVRTHNFDTIAHGTTVKILACK